MQLTPRKANARPQVLTANDKTADDVLVGDGWIGSGQSNTDMPVAPLVADDPVLEAAAGRPHQVPRLMRNKANAAWETSAPRSV